MSMNSNKKSEATLDDVLALIDDFKAGNFSKQLNKTTDPKLNDLVNSLNDVTKLLATQATQAASANKDRARIDALFTQSADAIMTLEPPAWKFTSCNPAALKLFKVSSEEEFLRLGPWNLSPEFQPDGSLSSEKAPAAILQAMKSGSYFFEWDHKTTNEEVVNCTVLLSRIDVAGEIYLQATVRDVTQEKSREREFKSIFWDSPLGIVRLDSNYRYLTANPAYEIFLDYSQQELSSKSMIDLTHPDDRGKTLENIQDLSVAGGGILKRLELRYLHKSGRALWGRVTIQSMADSVGKLTFLCIVEDVTEQKSNEIETSAILETMADGLVIQNENGVIENNNPAALSLLGLTEDQLRGRKSTDPSWKAIREDGSPFSGDDHPAMTALKTGAPVRGVVMGLNLPDTTERWIKINAIPFEGATGRRVACTFSDVTELFNTQSEIRFVLDALKIGVWKFNPIDQSLFWDKSMYQLFEVKESDFSGHYQAWESTLTPESKKIAVEELSQAIRGEKEFETVFEIKTKSNGKRFISGRGKVKRDENGKPIMMYGVNMDVTAQKMGDLERERVSSFLEVVLQNVPSMIFVKDYKKNLEFSLINRAGEALLGVKSENLIGKNDYDLFNKEQADFFTSNDKEVFKKRAVLKIDKEEIESPNGKRFLQTYKVPTFDKDNEPHLLIGISNDITDEIKVKEELELERAMRMQNAKLASLGEMSAGVAHEINNPLAIISGSVGLLSKFSDNPEKFAAKIEAIRKSCDRIDRIVGGLRKFSRSGEKSNFKNHELSKIVQDAFILIDAKSKRHSTSVTLDSNSCSYVLCDDVEIEQVLVNLINNAIDAVKIQPEKWIKVSLFDDAHSVVLRVTDSGPGIPDSVRHRIFDPFFTTKKVGEGTGLGLSITRGILDGHKATITVVPDSPNTCFEIRFPKVEAMKNAD